MNETIKRMNEPMSESPETPETEAQTAAKREFGSIGEAIVAGREEGAAQARTKAPELKSGIANVVHDLAYGLAYGTVFTGAFVNELIPEKIREGLSKGAEAGRKAGKEACDKASDVLSPKGTESEAPVHS
jgi:hypothetical protein